MIPALSLALLASLASLASSSPYGQEPAATATESGPHFATVEGADSLLWGERVVLRDLRFQIKGQRIPFDAAKLVTKVTGDRIQISAHADAEDDLQLVGTFSLDYDPEILQQVVAPDAPIQFAIGRIASELCDTLIARDAGVALVAPGCLDLDFWLEGGPAELRIKLRDAPTLELTAAPQVDDHCLTGLQSLLRAQAKDNKVALRSDIEELLFAELPKDVSRRALAPSMQPKIEGPTIINVRVGARPDQAPFDVLMLHNPGSETAEMAVNFQELGWDKPRKKRNLVFNADGSALGELELSCSIPVPAGGTILLTARSLMPRGVFVSSDGPLAPILRPWDWRSITSAPSGKVSFISTYECSHPTAGPGWIVLAVADGRNAPFRVGTSRDEQGEELVFQQRNSIVRIETVASEQELRKLVVEYDGRVVN
jgi:hypothetical protein